jgi:hypothetical protein
MMPSVRANWTAAAKVSVWPEGAGLDQPRLHEPTHHRRVAVVAQPAGVDGRRHEVVPEGVHRHHRRQARGVAVVVAVDAARQRRARRGSAATNRVFARPASVSRRNGKHRPPKFEPAADAADHDVGLLAGHLHLRDRLLADDGLVQADVREHRAERVVGLRVARGDLDGLGDRDAQRPGRVLGLAAARLVRSLGDRCTVAPHVCIIERRYGFWS